MIKLVYLREIVIGGSETLLLRLGRYYIRNNDNVQLYCTNIIDEMKEQFLDAKIKIKIVKSYDFRIKEDFNQYDTVICLRPWDFFKLNVILSSKKMSNIYLYVVHPSTLVEWIGVNTDRKLFKRIFRNNILKYSLNGQIIYMDKLNLQWTIDAYSFEFRDYSRFKMIYLPIDIKCIDEDDIRKRKERILILSVARAEFPFKGYLKGLIDAYSQLKKTYSNISLLIISSSDYEIEKLQKWINEKKDSSIQLLKDVPYDLLSNYYKKSTIYVGMGTTVLEACNEGVISFPVVAYTMECRTLGYFSENPYENAAIGIQGKDIKKYIENIINMDIDEYLKKSLENKQLFDSLYDIKILTNYFLRTRSYRNPTKGLVFLVFLKIIYDRLKNR